MPTLELGGETREKPNMQKEVYRGKPGAKEIQRQLRQGKHWRLDDSERESLYLRGWYRGSCWLSSKGFNISDRINSDANKLSTVSMPAAQPEAGSCVASPGLLSGHGSQVGSREHQSTKGRLGRWASIPTSFLSPKVFNLQLRFKQLSPFQRTLKWRKDRHTDSLPSS